MISVCQIKTNQCLVNVIVSWSSADSGSRQYYDSLDLYDLEFSLSRSKGTPFFCKINPKRRFILHFNLIGKYKSLNPYKFVKFKAIKVLDLY